MISAYRKSSHQDKDIKLLDLMPDKKMSYNEAAHQQKKRVDLQMKPDKYYRHGDNSTIEVGLRDKKRSGQY